MKKLLFLLIAVFVIVGFNANAQVSLTNGSTYTQDFNTLSSTVGIDTVLDLAGWELYEFGLDADLLYHVGDGGTNTPISIYSFGNNGNSTRSLGSLGDDVFTNTHQFGVIFVNNTGEDIETIEISYVGKQWRLGAPGVTDQLRFEYSDDATSVDQVAGASWLEYTTLNFTSPITTGSPDIGLDGEDPANQRAISQVISVFPPVPDGETFIIRWTDDDLSSGIAEHGLAIDDLSVTPNPDMTTTVQFVTSEATVSEQAGAYSINFTQTNPGATSTFLDIALVGGTGDASDINDFVTQNIEIIPAFPGGRITINFDEITDPVTEYTFVFEIQNVSGGTNAEPGTPSQFTLTITNDDFLPLHYRSKAGVNGLWSASSTWETSEDGITWVDATDPPTSTSSTITVRAGTIVRVQSDVTADELTIESGGVLIRQQQGFTVADGPGDDITIFGIFRHAGNPDEPIFEAGATVKVEAAGRIDVVSNNGNPSVYGTTTQVTWEPSSIFSWRSDQPFSSGTYFPNVSTDDLVFFNVSTNVVAQGLDNLDLVINGALRVLAGNSFTFGGTGTKTIRNGFRNTGDVVQEAGSGAILVSGDATTGASTAFGTDGGTYFLNDTQGLVIPAGANVVVSGEKIFDGGPITVDGTLRLPGGTNVKTMTVSHSGPGSVGITGTGTFNINVGVVRIASESPTFTDNFLTDPEGIVEFYSDELQNIPAQDYANLTSSGSGARVLAPTGTIGVEQIFTPGSNSYTIFGSTINFNGVFQQVPGFDYYNLTLGNSGSKLLFGTASVQSYLTLETNVSFNTNGEQITLLSSATETASLAPVPASASFIGELTAQRYAPNEGRIYRYVSSPVDQPEISQLQDNLQVTGNFIGASDRPPDQQNPSLFFYNETDLSDDFNAGYVAQPFAINTETLFNGLGYALFIWDKDNPTLYDLTGAPNIGDFNYTVTYTESTPVNLNNDGWNLLGNPYPSAIDWSSSDWTLTDIDPTVYIRDFVNDVFASYNRDTDVGVNGGTGIIASGQAFWVQALSDVAVVQSTEQVKSGQNDAEFFRRNSVESDVLRMTLTDGSRRDEVAVVFDERGNANYEPNLDALKFEGNAPSPISRSSFNLATLSSEGYRLAINTMASSTCQIRIPLAMNDLEVGDSYKIEFKGLINLSKDFSAEIVDKVSERRVDVEEGSEFEFTAQTANEERFEIRLTLNIPGPGIEFTDGFLSTDIDSPVWYLNDLKLDVSDNTFAPTRSGTYRVEYADQSCLAVNELDIIVEGNGFNSYFSVAPNPMISTLNLQSYSDFGSESDVEVIDIQGRRFISESMNLNKGYYQFDVSNLPSGVYILKITSANQSFTHRLMKQ